MQSWKAITNRLQIVDDNIYIYIYILRIQLPRKINCRWQYIYIYVCIYKFVSLLFSSVMVKHTRITNKEKMPIFPPKKKSNGVFFLFAC